MPTRTARVLNHQDRDAIIGWASWTFPRLVRSQYARVLWGPGRQHTPGPGYWPNGSGWLNAGVRVVRGRVVVENYRGTQVAEVPLAAIAVEVVAAMNPPDWAAWQVRDATDLLVYADWLDDRGLSDWSARVRRWARW